MRIGNNPLSLELSEQEKTFHLLEMLVLCMAGIFILLGAQGYLRNDAVNSRLATVYSLTKYGVWYIDRPSGEEPILFERSTIDKVMINGHVLSSKPPMLPMMMTAEYWMLNQAFGWDLDNDDDLEKIARFINLTLVGLPYLLALIFFAKTVRLFIVDPLARLVLIFCLAFCTQLWGYSTHLNNHVPATGMICIALYYALGLGSGKLVPRWWRFALFGVAGGLVPTLDIPGTIFVALGGLYLLIKHPVKTLVFAGMTAAVPLALHGWAMWASTGNLLPVQTRDEVYLYEGSYWRNPQGIDALNEPKAVYLFHMLFGRVGIFLLYPILFAGMAATLRAVMRRKMPLRGYILSGALAFVTLTAYYVYKTNNYGGEAFGFRWYIVAMPVLLLMGAPILAGLRRRWKWLFISILIGISFYSSFECNRSPWGSNHEWTVRLFWGRNYGR